MQCWDIVIHTNAAIFGNDQLLRNFPPVRQQIKLSQDIWIGRLEGEIAKAVMDICEPQTLGVIAPIRQFTQLYSFVRELPCEEMYAFDVDNILSGIIALSRLVHPTSTGLFYAARVGHESGIAKKIYPCGVSGLSKDVFLSPNRQPDWLTDTEVAELTKLTPHLQTTLPPRVHNALWHHEYAARTYYLDYRWILVCTGLEALVHTDRRRSTAQFVKRVPQLASEFRMSLTETEAEEAYDLRSRLAHGASFLSQQGSQTPQAQMQLNLYDRLEDTLRLAVLRSMQDSSFQQIFLDDNRIRNRWRV